MSTKLLTDDKGNKYVHCDFFAEITQYPADEFVSVEGDDYQLGETVQVPTGGWRVPLRLSERPKGVVPIHNLYITGEDDR